VRRVELPDGSSLPQPAVTMATEAIMIDKNNFFSIAWRFIPQIYNKNVKFYR